MPAHGRIVYDGAVCHVIQRGNNKQKIFKEGADYGKFLSLVREYKGRFTFELYNYCLMSNHLHLLIKKSCQGRHGQRSIMLQVVKLSLLCLR